MNIVVNYKLTSSKHLPRLENMLPFADVNVFDFRIAKSNLHLPNGVGLFTFRPDQAADSDSIIFRTIMELGKDYKAVSILDTSGYSRRCILDLDLSEFDPSVFDDSNIGIAYFDYTVTLADGSKTPVFLKSPPFENADVPAFFVNGLPSFIGGEKSIRDIFKDYPSKHIPKFLCHLTEV